MYKRISKESLIKISLIGLILLLTIALLSTCGKAKTTAKADDETINISQKVVFIQQYLNFAWGYQNYGHYIDNKGNVIKYDVSKEDHKYADMINLLGYLEKQENQTAIKTINMKELKEHYDYSYKINPNTELTKKIVGADMGSNTLYGVIYTKDGTPKMITIESKGDWEENNPDENAQKIKDWLRKILR